MKIHLVSLFFIFTGVILAENYRPPNMEKELFKVKKLAITEIGKTSLFAGLLSVARDFDEEENELKLEDLASENEVNTILEIKGIRCTSSSFNIEIEIKQIMMLTPNNLFEKCLFNSNKKIEVTENKIENMTSNANDAVDEVKEDIEDTPIIEKNFLLSWNISFLSFFIIHLSKLFKFLKEILALLILTIFLYHKTLVSNLMLVQFFDFSIVDS